MISWQRFSWQSCVNAGFPYLLQEDTKQFVAFQGEGRNLKKAKSRRWEVTKPYCTGLLSLPFKFSLFVQKNENTYCHIKIIPNLFSYNSDVVPMKCRLMWDSCNGSKAISYRRVLWLHSPYSKLPTAPYRFDLPASILCCSSLVKTIAKLHRCYKLLLFLFMVKIDFTDVI